MSKLLRGVRHVGKIKQQFQYSLVLDRAEFPSNVGSVSVLWTRGSRTASTDYIPCEAGTVQFEDRLTLMCSLFKNTKTGEYDAKRSRIILKERTANGKEKPIGKIILELKNYISPMESSYDLELPIQHRSAERGVLYCTLVCKWLRAVEQDDDTLSDLSSVVSGLESDIYSEAGDFEPLTPVSNFQIDRGHVEEEVFHLRLEALENNIREMTAENADLKEQLHNSQRRARVAEQQQQAAAPAVDHQLQAELAYLKETNGRLQNELIAARVQAESHERNDSQVSGLANELATTKARLTSYEQKYDELDKNYRDIEERLRTGDKEIERLHDDLSDKERAHVALDSVYQDLIKTMKNNKSNELLHRIAFYRTEVDDHEQTLEMVRKSWKESADIMRTQLNALQNALVKTRLENQELVGKYDVAMQTINKLEDDTTRLRQEKLKLSERLTKYEVKTAEKMVELISVRSRMQVAESRVQELESENDVLKTNHHATEEGRDNPYSGYMHLTAEALIEHVQKTMSASPDPPPPPSSGSDSLSVTPPPQKKRTKPRSGNRSEGLSRSADRSTLARRSSREGRNNEVPSRKNRTRVRPSRSNRTANTSRR